MFEDIFKHKILNQNEPVKVIGINKGVQASYVWNLFGECQGRNEMEFIKYP